MQNLPNGFSLLIGILKCVHYEKERVHTKLLEKNFPLLCKLTENMPEPYPCHSFPQKKPKTNLIRVNAQVCFQTFLFLPHHVSS